LSVNYQSSGSIANLCTCVCCSCGQSEHKGLWFSFILRNFPKNGEFLLRRLILQFRRAYRRNDKTVCLSSTRFIAHLVNQQVAHEILAWEILTLLLHKPTDDSVEVAIGFLKEVGMKLTEVSSRGVHGMLQQHNTVQHLVKLQNFKPFSCLIVHY